jgi:hypothetical protein
VPAGFGNGAVRTLHSDGHYIHAAPVITLPSQTVLKSLTERKVKVSSEIARLAVVAALCS